MAAYIFANIEVTEPAGFAEYNKQAPAAIASYGGRVPNVRWCERST